MAYCGNCGNLVSELAFACPGCGHPAGGAAIATVQNQRTNGIGVAGFVCGLLGLLLCWVPFIAWILGLLGVIFGIVGTNRAKSGASQRGLSIAGIVCGAAGIVLGVLIFAVVVNHVAHCVSDFSQYSTTINC